MILLDTNVVSEPLKPFGNPLVLQWIDAQSIGTLHLSAISLAELRFGMAVMPDGKRRCDLQRKLEETILPLFAGRILPFDTCATPAYALLRARARRAGRAIDKFDASIAAIAVVHGLTAATRDTSPFRAAGINFINPWEVAS
jgi:toxin FitB